MGRGESSLGGAGVLRGRGVLGRQLCTRTPAVPLTGPGLSCCPDHCLSRPARTHFPSCPLTITSLTFSPALLEATLAPSLTAGRNTGWFWRPGSGVAFKTPTLSLCPARAALISRPFPEGRVLHPEPGSSSHNGRREHEPAGLRSRSAQTSSATERRRRDASLVPPLSLYRGGH